ncbi:MAG: glucose-6-phosphate isomerase [Hyphomicrobiales bacterium]
MEYINIDLSRTGIDIKGISFNNYLDKAKLSLNNLIETKGKGNDFHGWIDLPAKLYSKELKDILFESERLASISDIIVVIGIGGSYLGSKAILDTINHHFHQYLPSDKTFPKVVFAGNQLSGSYLSDLINLLDHNNYSIICVSKSGTTTEPAVAFRILRKHLEQKYGKDKAYERIVAITDESKGALKNLALKEKYKTFIIPDDVGGRYSVFTPVGLLPVAVGGGNINELLTGAERMRELIFTSESVEENPAILYAVARNMLYEKNKNIEVLASFEPSLQMIGEWWKQLFGESEGKENKGIFPAAVNYTTDLHSMGQYMQEGERHLMETFLSIEKHEGNISIEKDSDNLDELDYLKGKSLEYVNKKAEQATILAHSDGGVPVIKINMPEKNEYYIGQLLYFFEVSCAISAYILDVNPFDQPGVEDYKRNMFALLNKPGYEKENKILLDRLKTNK